MPELSGIQLAKRIKQQRNIPVILSTGSLDDSLKNKAEKHNLNALIQKPFDYRNLLKRIKELA